MKDLIKTASVLDKVCQGLSIAFFIGTVGIIIGLCIIAAGFLFNLAPQVVGNGYEFADLDFVTFTVAEAYLPDHRIVWAQLGIDLFLSLLCLIPTYFIIKSVTAILESMQNRKPFHNTVSVHLGKIAKYVFALGISLNLQKIISNILLVKAYDLHLLLLSEKISHVDFHFEFDLSFLLVSGILLLLSYVFRYGEQLQQLSDETL